MSVRFIAHIPLNSQARNRVNGHTPGVTIMNRVPSDIRLTDITVHMEMDGITTQDLWLTHVSQFYLFNSSDGAFRSFTVDHDMGSVFVSHGIAGISLDYDVPREAPDFGSHDYIGSGISLDVRKVLKFQFWSKRYGFITYTCDSYYR